MADDTEAGPRAESEKEQNDEGTQGEEPLVEAPLGTPPALPQEGGPDVAGAGGLLDTLTLQRPESESASLPAATHTEPTVHAPGSVTFQRLELILERLEESCRASDDAAHFLRRRAEIEEVYAKSLRRLYEETAEAKVVSFRALKNKLTRGPASGEVGSRLTETSSRAWNAITAQTLQASQLHQAFAERISKGPATSLSKAALEAHSTRKEVEKKAQRLAKELQEAQKRLQRAQDAAQEVEKQAHRGATPPAPSSSMLGSLSQSLFKKQPAAVTAEAAQLEQNEANRRCDAAGERYNQTLPACLEELEVGEKRRLASLKAVLHDYMECSSECCKALVALYPGTLQLVSSIDLETDLANQFVEIGGPEVW